MVSFHPVTTEYKENQRNFLTIIKAVDKITLPTIWLYPNIDAGGDLIKKEILNFKSTDKKGNIHFFKHFSSEDYLLILKNASCVVGNSSVGIRETSFLGTPSVNIGSRQTGRQKSPNVMDCKLVEEEIINAISQQLQHGRYDSSKMYGDGKAGKKIANILLHHQMSFNKVMTY